MEALQWRIHRNHPDSEIRTNEKLRLESGDYVADLVVMNGVDSLPLLFR